MNKNVVFVTHEKGGNLYLFETDEPIARGTAVLVWTKYGERVGWSVTDSFEIGSAFKRSIYPKIGAHEPLRKVLATLTDFDIVNKILAYRQEHCEGDKNNETATRVTISSVDEDDLRDIQKAIKESGEWGILAKTGGQSQG